MTIELPDYYDRTDPTKHYDQHLIRAGKGIQSAEINEIQTNLIGRIKGIGNAIFKDGDIVRDCQILLADNGHVTLSSGSLYLAGMVRGVSPAEFDVPMNTLVQVGVRLVTNIITELEDPTLRSPAIGTRNFDEPGAARLQVIPTWGWTGDGEEGEFYPIYTIDNGVLLGKEPPPAYDSLTTAIAQYDRDSAGGHYIVDGLSVAASYDRGTNKVIVLVSEGRARVNGYPIEVPRGVRLSIDADPDPRTINAEPHTFTDGGGGTMRVDLNHTPLLTINQVRITVERTVTLTHGAFSGALDALPNNSVVAIVECKQGGTTYTQGTDYRLTDDQVDWSLSGAEPSPGSTYTCKYQYITTIANIASQDDTGFTIGTPTGVIVPSSVMQIDYNFAMPRIDSIVLGVDGRVTRLIGVANQYNPSAPAIPDTQLKLSNITHSWSSDPTVSNDAVMVMPMNQLQGMQALIFDLFDLVSLERLRNDVSLRDPSSKRGVFVDPLTNDNVRDAGISQTLAIINGEMLLAIQPDVKNVGSAVVSPELLPYELEVVIDQSAKTGDMLVNPYMAFDPIPADMTLSPAVDFWTATDDTWASPITNRFITGGTTQSVTTTTQVQVVNTNTRVAEFLRSIQVRFRLEGFGAGEILDTLTFDGIPVTPENP